MDKTERKKARRKEIRTIISWRSVEHEIRTLKLENYWAVQEDNYKMHYEACGKSFVPSKPTRLLPHVRNNTYRLLRLVEEMVLDGKSGEKEQALMHKRQETYEKRLKIQYQKKYSMEGTEPDSYLKCLRKLVRGLSKEFIGKSSVSDAEKEMWRTMMLIEKSLPMDANANDANANDANANDANANDANANDANANDANANDANANDANANDANANDANDANATDTNDIYVSVDEGISPVKYEKVQDMIPYTITPPVGSTKKQNKENQAGKGHQKKYFPPVT